ncbi:MAG: polysaccharide deacetylase family protein [Desulfobacterales bacterium]|jgi:peptidoglycan/xylan/chitin deacetylase (PgdA/CDA1 family)
MNEDSSNKAKPLASMSLDLDNQWSYMKTHGDAGWEDYPSYFDVIIPLVLDLLDQLNLKITFFIVGQDAALDKNYDWLRLLAERGHEVGNHSFHHEVWLHTYPKENIKREILEAEESIHRATGQKPVGFRGPGFVYSPILLQVLAENNYLYDATILPTFIGPLARAYYFWKSNLSREEKEQRKKIYSSFSEGFRPVKPYYWKLDSNLELLEIPVTTIPILKTPFHLSYLLYLYGISKILMHIYLKLAMMLCQTTKSAPSFLLHPLDFVGNREVSELSFFPGMDIGAEQKTKLFTGVIKTIRSHFELATMSAHAESVSKSIDPKFQNP